MLRWAVGLVLGMLLGCTASKPALREEAERSVWAGGTHRWWKGHDLY